MPPLALTDESLSTLMRLAEPLQPADRSRFLADVAAQLGRYQEVGEGLISRVARDCQKQYFRPLDLSRSAGSSKYR
jgi:hypothetical protein